MIIRVLTKIDDEFVMEDHEYRIPRYVGTVTEDVAQYEEDVQKYYIKLQIAGLINRRDTLTRQLENTDNDDKIDKIMDAIEEVESNLKLLYNDEAYDMDLSIESRAVASYVTTVIGISGLKIGVTAGFEKVYDVCEGYFTAYGNTEEFSDKQTTAFKKVMDTCNAYVAKIFGDDAEKLRGKDVKGFINDVFNPVKRGSISTGKGKQKSKLYGIRSDALKAEKAIDRFYIRFFDRNGCKVSVTKHIKLVDVVL